MPPVFKAAWNPNKQEREKGAEEVREALKILDKELKVNGKFFNGDSVEFLDIAALIIFYWVWVPIIQEATLMENGQSNSGDKRPKEVHLDLQTPINVQKGRALVPWWEDLFAQNVGGKIGN
ncbi:hypothetical protein K1719_031701 [Acacia pycnantha]|nr:hypothetical protein K1719_031701 [Acacia pycnantha]